MKPTIQQLAQLVGNPGAYAVQNKNGTWTPVRHPLTRGVLARHLAGTETIGTYVVYETLARTLVFDIDDEDPDQQVLKTKAIEAELRAATLPFMTEFSGNKGYHVWVVADDYVPATLLYTIGRGVREAAGLPALEVFPKQTEVVLLGSLVKLPGGVHRVTGKANDFIQTTFTRVGRPELEATAALYPEVRISKKREGSTEYPCVRNVQEGVAEGGRNTYLTHLAAMLYRWSISDENVEAIVRRANAKSADGGVPEAELVALLESARGIGPLCNQVREGEYGCGDQCFTVRHSKLTPREGALRWGVIDETIVVEVASRTDDGRSVELSHPDAQQIRAVLKKPGKKGTNGN